MAPRKKEAAPALFSVKHEFIAALENVCQQSIMMLTAIETTLQHSDLKPAVKEVLTERAKALRDALYGEED